MGSFSGTCEIVEAKEELTLFQHLNGSIKTKSASRMCERDRLPMPKVGRNKHLEDDLNQLFKKISINASSKSLDLSDSLNKNPLKNPIGLGVSYSPGSEITETVTLKKALRGLSISHASEVAAMKRLSKSSACSPRVSEAERITSLYQSVVIESTESSPSLKGSTINLHLMMKESSSGLSKNIPLADVGTETSNTKKTQKEKHASVSSPPSPNSGVKMKKRMEVSASTKSGHKVSPTKSGHKVSSTMSGRKGKLQTVSSSSSINGTRLNKITRNNHRLVKPVLKKRVIRKKSNQDPTSIDREAIGDKMPGKKSQMFCEKCQCAMKNVRTEPNQVTSISQNPRIVAQVHSIDLTSGASKLASIGETCNKIRVDVVKANKNSNSKDKGEFSQSSKSSLGDYSTCTSVSEESNPSGSSCGNRPHMSKDVRWEAIRHAQGHHGNLGLTNFNLVKKLGCGDIGTVYLAELIGASCLFAIKVMDNEYLAKRKKMPRAQTEREILRMLDHPFLPTLYSQFTSDNLSCLVMEFCPGGDLHVLRQKQPGRNFPEHAARFYVAEVLLALEYLHMLGVVYRDLKPENILVREDGHIMLTDFDLSLRCTVSPILLKSSPAILEPARMSGARMSGPCTGSSCIDPFCSEPSCKLSCFTPRMFPTATKAKSRMTNVELKTAKIKSLMQLVAEPTDARSNSFVGTHEYLAPEIIKGEGHGSAVDWWTYGIFLYELLYGKTPFKGSSNDDTLSNVVVQSLVFPDSPLASFQARDLIRRLLVKAPENRLGFERGAAEIKQHPFFEGLNWALIRCAIPPELPEIYEYGVSNMDPEDKKSKFLEFELF